MKNNHLLFHSLENMHHSTITHIVINVTFVHFYKTKTITKLDLFAILSDFSLCLNIFIVKV